MPPPDPSECFEQSPFGFGPFPEAGGVIPCDPHPPGGGFGGVSLLPHTDDGGPYGLASYGSVLFGAPPVPIVGGYGGDPYGLGPYGSVSQTQPRITSAISLDGFHIQVFFDRLMTNDTILVNAANYQINAVVGAPATVVSVVANADPHGAVQSVTLTHTGTTLGGSYLVQGMNFTDLSGNQIALISVSLLTCGEPPTYTVTVLSPTELLFTFAQDMLPQNPPGLPTTIKDTASYTFVSSPEYPITVRPESNTIEHPYLGDSKKVKMSVRGMTSLDYTSTVGPALIFDYLPTILPPSDLGVEVGVGSSYINGSALSLNRTHGNTYGWKFQAASGAVTPLTSTVRVDFEFRADSATYQPPLAAFPAGFVYGVLAVEDGPIGVGLLVEIVLFRTAGTDRVLVTSGGYSDWADVPWSVGGHTISFVRNAHADLIAILFDDRPLLSTAIANCTGVATFLDSPGIQWTLSNTDFDISGFEIGEVKYTASNTVFSGAWNFLHEAKATFIGSGVLARDNFLTQRGPLVKGWGDATPATVNDVTVYVNQVAVPVASVNPYIGEVVVQTPIPLLPQNDPQASVTIDYKWLATPVMEMAGLNTNGLILNKWDPQGGAHGPVPLWLGGAYPYPLGAPDYSRFPMGVVLGPKVPREPVQIAHRYIGFEKDYSALLNSPTTLWLNQNPNRVAVPGFSERVTGDSGSYTPEVNPISSLIPWTLVGTDLGATTESRTAYTLIDGQAGPYTPDNQNVAYYVRTVDLTFPAFGYVVGRLQIDSWSGDGVFTGVGLGLSDDDRIFLAGALYVNGVRHVGLLTRPSHPHLISSWEVGPKTQVTLESQTVLHLPTVSVPTGLVEGNRFQILSGPQAGVYTITHLVPHSNGTTTITVSTEFPAPFDRYGNKYPIVFFETRWDRPLVLRLEVNHTDKTAQLQISGSTSGIAVTLDTLLVKPPRPEESTLLFPYNLPPFGKVFWGSLSRAATNQSMWYALRYGIIPDSPALLTQGIVVNTQMSVVPEDDPNGLWFPTTHYGYDRIDSTGDRLLISSVAPSNGVRGGRSYGRTEPFLSPEANFDMLVKFQVDTASGVGDAEVVIFDQQRSIRLGTLAFQEDQNARTLWVPHVVRTVGETLPPDPWTPSLSTPPGFFTPHESVLVMDTGIGAQGLYYGPLATGAGDTINRITEARFAVKSHTPAADGAIGVLFSAIYPNWTVSMVLEGGATPGVRLVSSTLSIQSYAFDWTDGQPHHYRLFTNPSNSTVVLTIDDTVMVPALDLALFVGGGDSQVVFGGVRANFANVADSNMRAVVEWYSIAAHTLPDASVKRTLGVYVAGDLNNIDSWEIPRTDSTTASNSSLVGPVIQQMDWTQEVEVRILRDPTWGVTVFRPDLPLPPYFQGEDPGIPGSGYATQLTEPSAGWINVEYSRLPQVTTTFGSVFFGPATNSVTQQRWKLAHYRIFKHLTEDRRAPQHMVLNQYNVITSGEYQQDVTPGQIVIQTLDLTRVTLLPAHLYARFIYKIVDGATVYTPDMWTFDTLSQTITLQPDANGNPRQFSSVHAQVTVVFVPGKPITKDYLLGRPFFESATLLNEGTPPVPKGQQTGATRQYVQGSMLNSLGSVLSTDPNFLLNDPYRVVEFEDASDALYENLSFYEIPDAGQTGLIASICEGTLPLGTSGWNEAEGMASGSFALATSGTRYTQAQAGGPKQPLWDQRGGGYGHILLACGGNFVGPVVDGNGMPVPGGLIALGGNLGPGTAILFPSRPPEGMVPGSDVGGSLLQTAWALESLGNPADPQADTWYAENVATPGWTDTLMDMTLV